MLNIACKFPFLARFDPQLQPNISRLLLHVLVRTASPPTPKNEIIVKGKRKTKEGYSQSYYFPVHFLGTTPSLVCLVFLKYSSSTPIIGS